jgi:F0F1-type ATP synthase membrane subunit b/b'
MERYTKGQINKARANAEVAKMQLRYGNITLAQAKELASDYINIANNTAVRLAKECGVSPRLINVSSYLR